MSSTDTIDFTIKVKMQRRWVPHFLGMLRYMQQLGSRGSSREIRFFSDGDGDFRPMFSWDIASNLAPPCKEENGNRFYDAG